MAALAVLLHAQRTLPGQRQGALCGSVVREAADGGGRQKQFHVSLFQAAVLLQFNDADALSYTELLQRTGMDKDELGRTLKSLCMGKVRVVVRSRAGDAAHITEGDEFRWKHGSVGGASFAVALNSAR